MIVIIDKEHVYTYNLSVESFWQLYEDVADEKRAIISPDERSAKISAKNDARYGKDRYNSQRLAEIFPEIKACYCVTDEGLVQKSFQVVQDLDYYVAPNNEKYTCRNDYLDYLSGAVPSLETLVADKGSVEQIEDVLPVEVDEEVVPLDIEVIEQLEETPSDVIVDEVAEEVIEESEPIIEGPKLDDEMAGILASFDKVLDEIPHIHATFGEDYMEAIKRLVVEDDRAAKVAVLEGLLPNDIFQSIMVASRFNDIVIDNNFGQSTDFIDSINIFPVYSIILSKKNLEKKFSYLDAIGSQFIRFCPIGIVENELVQGFIQRIEITNKDITVVKKMLVRQLKDLDIKAGSLTDAEKLAVFEEVFALYVEDKFGNIINAESTLLVDSLNGYLAELDEAGYSISRLKDEFGGFTCEAETYLLFDNRLLDNNNYPVPLLVQTSEKFAEQKSVVVEDDGFKPEPGVIYLGGRTVQHEEGDLDEFNAVVAEEEDTENVIDEEQIEEVIVEVPVVAEETPIVIPVSEAYDIHVEEPVVQDEVVSAEATSETSTSIADMLIQRFIEEGTPPTGFLNPEDSFAVDPDRIGPLGGVDPVTGMYIDKDGKRYQNEALFRKINGLPDLPDEEEKRRGK